MKRRPRPERLRKMRRPLRTDELRAVVGGAAAPEDYDHDHRDDIPMDIHY